MKLEKAHDIFESVAVLDSEQLVDAACDGLLAIMELVPKKNILGYQIGPNKLHKQQFMAILDGIYMPGSMRSYWAGYFDVGVDELPDTGCVYIEPDDDVFYEYATVRRIKRLPRRIFCQCRKPVAYYEVTRTKLLMRDIEKEKGGDPGKFLVVEVSYFAIGGDGAVWLTIDINKRHRWQSDNDWFDGYHIGPGAISLLADRKYLWMVETAEDFGKFKAKMCFGVEEEYVKSLMYAREAPLTPTGRKRPILHWVDSHKRRLQKGIDVDVRKHLRGITDFPIGGIGFKITKPKKECNENSPAQ